MSFALFFIVRERREMRYQTRQALEKELKKTKNISQITRTLGINRTTIYAEFKRAGMDKTNYNAHKAQLSEVRKNENV